MNDIIVQLFSTPDSLVFAVGFSLFLMLLVYWHIDKATRFDIRDLLVDKKTGRLSLYKIGQFFALIVSTWVIVRETNSDRLTEWLFIAYMAAWSGANLANKYLDRKTGGKSEDPIE